MSYGLVRVAVLGIWLLSKNYRIVEEVERRLDCRVSRVAASSVEVLDYMMVDLQHASLIVAARCQRIVNVDLV